MGRKKKPTSYGRLVLNLLKKRDMRLLELAELVEIKTGRFVDANFLYNYLCGVPTPWKIRKAVADIMGLEDRYGKRKAVLPGQPGDPQ